MNLDLPLDDLQPRYDAIVVGGGIQGAGCAQALAAAGFATLLVEQNTIASATSSRSSKLIHGGLRYIESAQFSLVRKSLQERSVLQALAPSLIRPRPFFIPVYRGQRLKAWQLHIALTCYWALGGFGTQARYRSLPREQWSRLPGLKQDELVAVFEYSDCQTDDVELTKAVIRSAQSLGCDCVEHTRLVNGTLHATTQAELLLEQAGIQRTVSCELVVNAAGPWASGVQQSLEQAPPAPAVDLVKGSHIEFDLPVCDSILYVEAPSDRRAVFIIPWKGGTMVGTTEQPHTGDPARCDASIEEIEYLEATLRHYFPDYQGQRTADWAGLRVLPSAAAPAGPASLRPFSARARDTLVIADNPSAPRLVSLFGGKLTAYRATAAKVAKMAQLTLGEPKRQLDTADCPLS